MRWSARCPARRLGNSLAESWTESPDGLVYEFRLRRGIRFHNGEPITTDDVKFSFERYRGAGATEPQARVRQVEIVDPAVVRFHLREPWPDFMTFYGTTATAAGLIVPRTYVTQVGDEGFRKHPIGAGPYRFVSHAPGVEVVLEANPGCGIPDRRGTIGDCGWPPTTRSIARPSTRPRAWVLPTDFRHRAARHGLRAADAGPASRRGPGPATARRGGYPNGIDAGDFVPIPPFFATAEAAVNYLNAVGIRVRIRTMERAAFYAAWREKKLRGLFMVAAGNSGNADSRVAEFVSSKGSNAYGGYPDIDDLVVQQARERDPRKIW
jgi:ABC-type transport system substrate-binding protein